ncbi:unnamed protein product [Urochloa humidicola]
MLPGAPPLSTLLCWPSPARRRRMRSRAGPPRGSSGRAPLRLHTSDHVPSAHLCVAAPTKEAGPRGAGIELVDADHSSPARATPAPRLRRAVRHAALGTGCGGRSRCLATSPHPPTGHQTIGTKRASITKPREASVTENGILPLSFLRNIAS